MNTTGSQPKAGSSALTVTAVTVERPTGLGLLLSPRAVLVNASGPRGRKHEFTVNLTRKGDISCGVQTLPSYVYYIQPTDIPGAVREAAKREADRIRQ